MTKYKCENGCCTLEILPYANTHDLFHRVKRKKAGVFIYDPNTDKVLIVQSKGHLWGPPKGTLDIGETERNCAIREVKEETGLDISVDDFTKAAKIKNKAIYFYMEKSVCDVHVQKHIMNNDANGVGWIKMDCLSKCIENGNITLSKHCHIVFEKFKNKSFPPNDYTLVDRSKRKSPGKSPIKKE